MSVEISSSDDIIYETPPRKLQKRGKRRIKRETRIVHHFEDHWIDTREEFKENIKIDSASVGSENRPYVYRSIDELLEFSHTCFPKNSNCHLVAILKFHENYGHCLVNNSSDSKFIQVDMKMLRHIPSDGDFISAYGSLEFREGCFRNLILVVRFYRPEASAIANEYKKNLKLIRPFVPSCYLATISLRT